MDIVKRAYLGTKERNEGSSSVEAFHKAVIEEIKRLIRVRVYSGRDWPRELGPLPDELRSKRQGTEDTLTEEIAPEAMRHCKPHDSVILT